MENPHGSESFVRNAWYVAGWSTEVGRTPLARRILGQPLVFYRTESGAPVAFVDRCPHKLAPLSRGEVVGDLLQCGYHGVQFDPTGRCVRIPGQPPIPKTAHLTPFPLVERFGLIWIWPGDPAQADPAAILDVGAYEKPGWGRVAGGYLHFATHYLNLTDNLVDPAHTSYVHKKTIGSAGGEDAPVEVDADDTRVVASRWVKGAEPVPIMKKFGGFKGLIDRWQYYTLFLPSISHIDFGAFDAGSEPTEATKDAGFRSFSFNFLTPESGRSTHYFWLHLRNYGGGDAAIDADIVRLYTLTFEEDRDILEDIQKNQDETGQREVIRLSIDKAPIFVRKRIQRMIEAEQPSQQAAE